MTVLYVVGLPGAGKTTAVAEAHRQFGEPVEVDDPVPHLSYPNADVVQLGRDRGAFSGTDALSMGINPKACAYVRAKPAALVTGEGDRLANSRFFETAVACGQFVLVWLDCPPALARARARDRAEALGRPQQPASWWKGRLTKVDNLVGRWADHVVRISADDDPERVAARLTETLLGAVLAS